MEIDCIVYSRDRACQLDLLLRSTREKFKNVGKVFVLYTYSDPIFLRGYEVITENPFIYNFKDIKFIKQNNFQLDVLQILREMTTESLLGLCDDDVFIRDTDCSDIINKLNETDASAISLKAGLNITGNYPNIPADQPEFIEVDPYLKWDWTEAPTKESDWNYPTCINSYIFKKAYFLWLICGMTFHNPPTLEGALNTRRKDFNRYMYSFKEQKLLNIPANRVQTISPNAFASLHHYAVGGLNDQFLQGRRISTENIYKLNPSMGNEEVGFLFERD